MIKISSFSLDITFQPDLGASYKYQRKYYVREYKVQTDKNIR